MKINDYQQITADLKPYIEQLEKGSIALLEPLDPYSILREHRDIFDRFRNRKHRARPRTSCEVKKIVGSGLAFDRHMDPDILIYFCSVFAQMLSRKDLHIPFHEEMKELLNISGVSYEDLVRMVLGSKLTFPMTHLHPEKAGIVYLLTKVMSDAVQRRDAGILNAVNDYLVSHDLITADLSSYVPVWNEFAYSQIENSLKLKAITQVAIGLKAACEEKSQEIDEARRIIMSTKLAFYPSFNENLVPTELGKKLMAGSISDENEFERLSQMATGFLDGEHGRILGESLRYVPSFVSPYDIARGFYASLLDGDETLGLSITPSILSGFVADCPVVTASSGIDAKIEGLRKVTRKDQVRIYDENESRNVEFDCKVETEHCSIEYRMPLTSILSSISKVAVSDSLYIRRSVMEFFRQLGLSERRARDLAIVVAMKEKTLQEFDPDSIQAYLDNLYPDTCMNEAGNDSEENEEILKLKGRIEELEHKIHDSEKEMKSYRHQIRSLENQLEEESEKHEKIIEEMLRENENTDDTGGQDADDIQYPYHTDRKITLYGGFDVFHRELKKLLPEIKIVEPCYRAPNLETFRNSDMVFIQPNKLNHSNYFAVRDASKNANVPYYHLRYACARKCADFIVGEIEGLDRTEARSV